LIANPIKLKRLDFGLFGGFLSIRTCFVPRTTFLKMQIAHLQSKTSGTFGTAYARAKPVLIMYGSLDAKNT